MSGPVGTLAGKALDRLAEDVALFRAALAPGGGSNNWVIAPTRTATGRPLLANDPHLAAVLPPYWYLAHLRMPDWDLEDAQALQMDQASLPWREIRGEVLAIRGQVEETRQAVALLRDWDGVLGADSAAAALFEDFLAEMLRRMAQAKAPKAAQWALGKGFSPLAGHSILAVRRTAHLVRLIREQPDGWFNRPWPQIMGEALGAAVRTLRTRRGPDPGRWGWGQIRTLTLRCGWSWTWATGTRTASPCRAASPGIRSRRTTRTCFRFGNAARVCPLPGRRRRSNRPPLRACGWCRSKGS